MTDYLFPSLSSLPSLLSVVSFSPSPSLSLSLPLSLSLSLSLPPPLSLPPLPLSLPLSLPPSLSPSLSLLRTGITMLNHMISQDSILTMRNTEKSSTSISSGKGISVANQWLMERSSNDHYPNF